MTTLAGSGSPAYGDGVGVSASFAVPWGIAVDSNGTVYVADRANQRIRKITASGSVTTLAGFGTISFSDGFGTAAQFNSPYGVGVDINGTVYVVEYDNNRVRKISPSGNVTTLAGSGNAAYADGVGALAFFQNPQGVAVDLNGTVYVADTNNFRIRKVSPLGNVTTYAGKGDIGVTDGNGVDASFGCPVAIAVDSDGCLYVVEQSYHKIRKINSSRSVTTIAGSGIGTYADGVGIAASFRDPTGIAVDSYGWLYIADRDNSRIRTISPLGNVTTLAGSGDLSYADGVGTAASFVSPLGVAVDSTGTVYVSDEQNHRIRKIL